MDLERCRIAGWILGRHVRHIAVPRNTVLAGKPLPTCARERGHGVDVFRHNTPVHNRLCFWARHCVGDIGATRRQRSANNHSENQAHVTFPQCFAKRW